MKILSLFALVLSISAFAAEKQNVCVNILTYPEGDHQNYQVQILGEPGRAYQVGDALPVEISQPFSPMVQPLKTELKLQSNSSELLSFRSDDGKVVINVDKKAGSGSVAPFNYTADIRVNLKGAIFSSAATPKQSDPSQTVAMPYTAQILNPAYPNAKGRGELIGCGF